MILVEIPKRGVDPAGDGAYGAPRGERLHRGEDFACPSGARVYSPVNGKITGHGYAYRADFDYRIVDLECDKGFKHRLFYVKPLLHIGAIVWAGRSIVGVCQDIKAKYPHLPEMQNHIHYEIIDPNGAHIDPKKYEQCASIW